MEVESNPSFFFDSILKRRRTVAWILMCSLRCRETKYWHLSNIFTVTILYFHCDNGALRSAFNFSFEHTSNFCLCECYHVGHGAFWWPMNILLCLEKDFRFVHIKAFWWRMNIWTLEFQLVHIKAFWWLTDNIMIFKKIFSLTLNLW